jgi:hypothetical protein
MPISSDDCIPVPPASHGLFLRDYSLNTMCEMSDFFFNACTGRDFDALSVWCLGA